MKEKIESLPAEDNHRLRSIIFLARSSRTSLCYRSVDFFNSIPYSEALQGNVGKLYPKYDDPKEIYISVLDDFNEIADGLTSAYNNMNADNKAFFAAQDVALKAIFRSVFSL